MIYELTNQIRKYESWVNAIRMFVKNSYFVEETINQELCQDR